MGKYGITPNNNNIKLQKDTTIGEIADHNAKNKSQQLATNQTKENLKSNNKTSTTKLQTDWWFQPIRNITTLFLIKDETYKIAVQPTKPVQRPNHIRVLD